MRSPPAQAFTLVELMIVVAIMGTLAAIAIPTAATYIERANYVRALAEIRTIEMDIIDFQIDHNFLPDTLAALGRGLILDPWGNPYQYLNIAAGKNPKGKFRKDRFLVPVNSDYDLYSMGKDGKTSTPFTAKASHDDIVRCTTADTTVTPRSIRTCLRS